MTVVLQEFRLPDLGEGLTESEIIGWRIAPGDRVALNQVIADVETAKAVVELPSPVDGLARTLHAEPGDTVEVGATIVTFEVDGDDPADEHDDAADAADEVLGGAAEVVEPNLVGYGARAEHGGRPARRPRRDTAGVPAEPTGSVLELGLGLGATSSVARAERPRSTPPVRRLAERLTVDLAAVDGSGPAGRVTREDVLSAAATIPPHPSPTIPGDAARADEALEHRIPIRGVRKHTAAAMVASAFTAPQATVFLTIDVTPTMELVERLRENPEFRGVRIGVLAVIARAVCLALRAHPELNSRWDEAAQEIVQSRAVHLGIAAATARGLIVPHLRDAHTLELAALSAALGTLVDDARAGRVSPERLRGGTITISNVGVFGVDAGTPILNSGEAAILAVGAVRSRPWAYRGELALRQTMTLSLSFDHRVVDGERASRFLAAIGALLADPALALAWDGGTGLLPIAEEPAQQALPAQSAPPAQRAGAR